MSSEGEDSTGTGGQSMLVAEYVLGLLDAPAHARIERQMQADAALRAERDFWLSRLSGLDGQFEEAAVPAYLRSRIETRIFGAPAKPASLWDSLALWRTLAASALAVAVIAIGFNVLQPAPDSRTLATQLVAALEAEGSDVKFLALYDGTGNVRLTALSGAPVPDRDFELWAIEGSNAPVSMGVIPANARSEVPIPPAILAQWGEGSVLAITLEPMGGSPSGAPTGPVVASGVATPI